MLKNRDRVPLWTSRLDTEAQWADHDEGSNRVHDLHPLSGLDHDKEVWRSAAVATLGVDEWVCAEERRRRTAVEGNTMTESTPAPTSAAAFSGSIVPDATMTTQQKAAEACWPGVDSASPRGAAAGSRPSRKAAGRRGTAKETTSGPWFDDRRQAGARGDERSEMKRYPPRT